MFKYLYLPITIYFKFFHKIKATEKLHFLQPQYSIKFIQIKSITPIKNKYIPTLCYSNLLTKYFNIN